MSRLREHDLGSKGGPRRRAFVGRWVGLSVVLVVACVAYGQQKPPDDAQRKPLAPETSPVGAEAILPPLAQPQEPVNCELAGRYIDDAVRRALRIENSNLIIIIRPGSGESSPRLNRLRLRQVKAYMHYISLPEHVVAVGEGVPGNGRIELYVGGASLYSLPLRKNQGLDLLSCVAP
jgi:hypothetical protein